MEVHHHPEVEKKGFKEYILEGLMIFLAVLMGFVAENIRESITEHKRAVEFAKSYYGDIKKDTLRLHQALRFSAHKIAAADSVITILSQPENLRNDTLFYYKSMVAATIMNFEPSAGNYEQIKSTGAIRDFKQKMIDLMNQYDLQARRVIRRDDIAQKFATDQLVPFVVATTNLEVSYDIMTKVKIDHDMHLTWSPTTTRQCKNIVVYVKILTLRSVQEYKKLLLKADDVLAELKKEYDLEDE